MPGNDTAGAGWRRPLAPQEPQQAAEGCLAPPREVDALAQRPQRVAGDEIEQARLEFGIERVDDRLRLRAALEAVRAEGDLADLAHKDVRGDQVAESRARGPHAEIDLL